VLHRRLAVAPKVLLQDGPEAALAILCTEMVMASSERDRPQQFVVRGGDPGLR
jgi:hypothetical protein